ncbi:mitogen-activated protein kinase kinase kinase NPK1 [Impatiens glandulifera]|uniref:mitogen-activated protein kinase kinase kinase NPK1 n=1 Tax=Impatiens glandulifera TaxID=253017 RepID=UPI001FB1438C|nr:mitogen-activated protein kinase kinase kinase NPK1 [Impatiens glandulifera]
MQDFIGSVRRSLVFKQTNGEDGGRFGGFVEKIGSSIRKSRIGLFSKTQLPALPASGMVDAYKMKKDDTPSIRWRKGELIGCGAFGRVYMGMNLDSGELIAVKQVLIATNHASKEKTQSHIRELEEEVKLLKNLKHPNIVRYLGTGREDESLNILLEFVPGGSISSLLGNFGSFPESVIRMYTKQLLLGLEYLHDNEIMHRDIKGANILVDNKGCIKLADFGASKKVVELATMTGAKSMKGTPYWMAPEVILQTGHSYSADIWSVGCTVIEMATGEPPWSQQFKEVAALFHIGTTKSHPPIPEHLSPDAKDFLLKCLQKEPNLRSTALELLQHPFVKREHQETPLILHSAVMQNNGKQMATARISLKNSLTCMGLDAAQNSMRCSSIYPEKFTGNESIWKSSNRDDDMCRIDDDDLLLPGASSNFSSALISEDCNMSFNPILEPNDDFPSEFDGSPELGKSRMDLLASQTYNNSPGTHDFTFPNGSLVTEDDDDEVTESKIKDFLDAKVIDLKKLQTPLYKEFYNSLNAAYSPSIVKEIENKENIMKNNLNLPPKSRSPKQMPSRRLSTAVVHSKNEMTDSVMHGQVLEQAQRTLEPISPSISFSERQRRWKEELDEELKRTREIMRSTPKTSSSPKEHSSINGIKGGRSRFGLALEK